MNSISIFSSLFPETQFVQRLTLLPPCFSCHDRLYPQIVIPNDPFLPQAAFVTTSAYTPPSGECNHCFLRECNLHTPELSDQKAPPSGTHQGLEVECWRGQESLCGKTIPHPALCGKAIPHPALCVCLSSHICHVLFFSCSPRKLKHSTVPSFLFLLYFTQIACHMPSLLPFLFVVVSLVPLRQGLSPHMCARLALNSLCCHAVLWTEARASCISNHSTN